MLDETPTGWSLRGFDKLAELQPGFAFKSEKFTDFSEVGLPLVRIRDLVKQGPAKYIDDEVPDNYVVKNGDILVGMDGEFNCVVWRAGNAALNQRVLRVFEKSGTERIWLHYLLQPILAKLESEISGTTVKHLSTKHLKKLAVPTPPLPEQERIAEVLTSVDDSIRATEAVIAQAERVKRGLMEDLLTGGLGSEAIARGEVPEGWQVKPISDWQIDLVDGDRGKEYPKSNEFLDEGFCLFLNAKNVTKTGWQFDERKFISEERHLKLRKGTLERGDIVITTRGTIGSIAYYDDRVPFDVCRINSGMAIFRNCDPNILTPFLKVQLEAVPIQRQIETLTYGSAQPALTIKTLKSLSLPVPEENEQERIIAALATADENLTTNQLILSQLQTVKRGLMDDLLTGRVRTV